MRYLIKKRNNGKYYNNVSWDNSKCWVIKDKAFLFKSILACKLSKIGVRVDNPVKTILWNKYLKLSNQTKGLNNLPDSDEANIMWTRWRKTPYAHVSFDYKKYSIEEINIK